MKLIESLKEYFQKKDKDQKIASTPNGVCPNCWGKQEWDGEYYKFMKGQNYDPSEDTYNNFIQDVARRLDKITLKKNSYICETCNVDYT